VGSLWNASLCPDGSFELFYGSEADVMRLRRASLCPDGSFGLFFGSEAVVSWL